MYQSQHLCRISPEHTTAAISQPVLPRPSNVRMQWHDQKKWLMSAEWVGILVNYKIIQCIQSDPAVIPQKGRT